jgi:hypothetical protein
MQNKIYGRVVCAYNSTSDSIAEAMREISIDELRALAAEDVPEGTVHLIDVRASPALLLRLLEAQDGGDDVR